MNAISLMCPGCHEVIPWEAGESLSCPGCGKTVPVRNGTVILRNNENYFSGPLSRQKMQQLIARCHVVGWKMAIAEGLGRESGASAFKSDRMFIDDEGAAFKVLLPPTTDARVLVLGCKSGNVVINLSSWFREIVACDLTYENLALLGFRIQEKGLANVRLMCGGDTRPLPFPNCSFDCVVLDGALDWSPLEGSSSNRKVQVELLSEIRRILTPDGHLYIGIENRFGFHRILRRFREKTKFNCAYSREGYKGLLCEAGFFGVRFFSIIPDHTKISEVVALDGRAQISVPPSENWKGAVRRRLERNKLFAPSFGIVSSTELVRKAWVEQLVSHIDKVLNLNGTNAFPRIRVSGAYSGSLLIFIGEEVIVRMPLGAAGEGRVQSNFQGLIAARDLFTLNNSVHIPTPLLNDTFGGIPFTVESFLKGETLCELPAHRIPPLEDKVFNLLIEMKLLNAATQSSDEFRILWKSDVIGPLERVVNWTVSDQDKTFMKRLMEFAYQDRISEIPLAFSHGDFWSGNVMVLNSGHSLGLVDWDGWASRQLVTHDFLHYICHRRMLRDNCSLAEAFCMWLAQKKVDDREGEWTKQFAGLTGLIPGWEPWAGFAYWVRRVACAAGTKLEYDFDWRRRNFCEVMPRLCKRLESN